MNLFVSLRYVFAVILFAEFVTGNAEGDASSVTGATECSIAAEERSSVNDALYNNVEECLSGIISSSMYHLLGNNGTREQIQAAFGNYCRSLPEISQCLDKVTSDANICLNETLQTRFRLFRQYKELVYEVGCGRNGGEDLAYIFEAVGQLENDFPEGCQKNATARVDKPNPEDSNGVMVFEYKMLRETLGCLEQSKGRGYDSLVDLMASMGTQIMDRLKCVQDGTDVLCKTIVDGR